MGWIWQEPGWPAFRWDRTRLISQISELDKKRGQVSALVQLDNEASRNSLDVLLETIIASSAIEGEKLDRASVRSSLANKLGLSETEQKPGLITDKANGVANLVLDAISNTGQPLSEERLFTWHRWLFPENEFRLEKIDIGRYRPSGQMQVVSGRTDRPTIHFEAPDAKQVAVEMGKFIGWFNESGRNTTMSAFERAALAHLWFVTIHPFDDGNGRIARAISDLALAQGDPDAVRAFSMSSAILQDRKGYYEALERCQSGPLTVDSWMDWFLNRIEHAMTVATERTERTLDKARFWDRYKDASLIPEQTKALNKLLDGVFPEGLSAKKYMAFTGVSKPTATRHLGELVRIGCLEKSEAGGRSTVYRLADPQKPDDRVQLSAGQSLSSPLLPADDLEEWQYAEFQLIRNQIRIAEAEINMDIDKGTVPADIQSFEDLHEHVDANMYVSDLHREASPVADYCADNGYAVQGCMRVANEITEPLDRWLRNGRHGSAMDYHSAPARAAFFISVGEKVYPIEDFAAASRLHLAAIGRTGHSTQGRSVWIETPKGDRVGKMTPTGQVIDDSGGTMRILYQPGTPRPLRISEGTGDREKTVARLKAYPSQYLLQWHAITAAKLASQPRGQAGRKGIERRETNIGLQVLSQELRLRGLTPDPTAPRTIQGHGPSPAHRSTRLH